MSCLVVFFSCVVSRCRSSRTRVYSQDKPDQYLTRLLSQEVCACESPEVRSEEARAMKKSRGQRGTTYGDGAYLEIERVWKGRTWAERVRVIRAEFILAPKRTGAGRHGRPSVAASRLGKAGMLILENPLPIRINCDFLEASCNPAWSDDACS